MSANQHQKATSHTLPPSLGSICILQHQSIARGRIQTPAASLGPPHYGQRLDPGCFAQRHRKVRTPEPCAWPRQGQVTTAPCMGTGDDVKRLLGWEKEARSQEQEERCLGPAMGYSSIFSFMLLSAGRWQCPIKPSAAAATLLSSSSACSLKEYLLKINSSGSKKQIKLCRAASPASSFPRPLLKVLHSPILSW